jgi:hypothetical protein
MPGRVFVGFIWMCEFMDKKYTPNCTSFLLGFDGLVLIWVCFWLTFINNNWKSTQIYYFCLEMCGLIPLIFYFPDSIRFLHTHGEYEKVRKILSKIAGINKKTDLQKSLLAPETEID